MYVEEVNPRRTQLIGKRAISGWKLINPACNLNLRTEFFKLKVDNYRQL
jgi:hypothetical protein